MGYTFHQNGVHFPVKWGTLGYNGVQWGTLFINMRYSEVQCGAYSLPKRKYFEGLKH